MSRRPHRVADYLAHIVEAIERIQRYVTGLDEEGFRSNTLVQDGVIRNLEIIGEASRNIERQHPEFAAAHPELPLESAWQMRNAVAHGYFSIDLGIVWNTIQRDLPGLLTAVRIAAGTPSRLAD